MSTPREQRRSRRAARSRAWPCHQGDHPIHEQDLPQYAEQATAPCCDDPLLLHIFYPPWEPCASPPTFLPLTTSTTSVPTTSPVRAWRFGETADGVIWPCAPSAVPTSRHLSAPVPTCRHPLPVASWWGPLSQRAPCCAGRETTHRGGRAPARVEHWHRTCTLSDQHPCSPVGGMVGHARRVPQRPGSPDVRQALETGQVVLVPYRLIHREGGLKQGRKPRCTRPSMICRPRRVLR